MTDTAGEIPPDTPARVRQLATYWHGLGGGRAPDRRLIDPGAIVPLLPFVLLVEFQDAPFRVRYRLTGTKVDEMTGMNITGHYLDEFAQGRYREIIENIQQCYAACRETGRAAIETYHWPNDRDLVRLVWTGMFPLTLDGQIRQCLSIEDYGPLGPLSEPINWGAALKR